MELKISLAQLCEMLVRMSDWHNVNNDHDVRVSQISIAIGEKLGLSLDMMMYLRHAALLHDIGRVGVDDYIMNKSHKLTKAQMGAVKEHPVIGYEIIRGILPKEICEGVLYHQECYDGSGYPKGLQGLEIPVIARIIKIADEWDALRNNRPYRDAYNFYGALKIMQIDYRCFDPNIYKIFLEIVKHE